jgi:ribose 5-phosphate isomerase B
MSKPSLYIASDHAGFELKSHLLRTWKDQVSLTSATGPISWTWNDLGPFTADRVDYPDYAKQLCRELLASHSTEIDANINTPPSVTKSFGILICGSGQGMAMTANRFPGIRAALAWNIESAQLARSHNDANILCLGARLIEPELAVNLVETFLWTSFEGGRHSGRIEKIEV